MDTGAISQLLAGLFSAGGGIQQLTSGNNAAAAATANPFGSQYGAYQPQVQNQVNATGGAISGATSQNQGILGQLLGAAGNIQGSPQALGTASSLAGQSIPVPSSVTGAAGSLDQQLTALSSNFMQDPAIQAEYQTGLDATTRGLQASGYGGSGQQQVALEQYGQQFAAGAYQEEFQNLINQSTTEFGENTQATTLGAGLQSQQFGENSTLEQLVQQLQTGQLGGLATAGQYQLGGTGQTLSAEQGLLNTLLPLSGATTGSPSTAGIIQSQQFGNTQQAIANLGSGATGILGGLSSLLSGLGSNTSNIPGISDLFNNLLTSTGDMTGTFAGDTIGGLSDTLGAATTGGLESIAAGGADTGASEGLSALLGL